MIVSRSFNSGLTVTSYTPLESTFLAFTFGNQHFHFEFFVVNERNEGFMIISEQKFYGTIRYFFSKRKEAVNFFKTQIFAQCQLDNTNVVAYILNTLVASDDTIEIADNFLGFIEFQKINA